MHRILILGGTGDSARLIPQLAALPDVQTIASLAGRTPKPNLPTVGEVRIGGFGGVAGLIQFLCDRQITLLVDATHPFAAQIQNNAAIAAQAVGIPRLRLSRPAWDLEPGDRWIEVPDLNQAAQIVSTLSDRIFLTIGRQELGSFSGLRSQWFLMRMITPPDASLILPPGEILLDQGPFEVSQEKSLLQHYQIGAIVSKNSGGSAAYGKIIAARDLGIPIVMIPRPKLPPGDVVPDVAAAIGWVRQQLGLLDVE